LKVTSSRRLSVHSNKKRTNLFPSLSLFSNSMLNNFSHSALPSFSPSFA
jgi:hypothetical protein